jgi:hypothetical protein
MSRYVHICILIGWDPASPPPSPHFDSYYKCAIKIRSQTAMFVIRIPNNSSMIHTFTNQTVKRGGQKANA